MELSAAFTQANLSWGDESVWDSDPLTKQSYIDRYEQFLSGFYGTLGASGEGDYDPADGRYDRGGSTTTTSQQQQEQRRSSGQLAAGAPGERGGGDTSSSGGAEATAGQNGGGGGSIPLRVGSSSPGRGSPPQSGLARLLEDGEHGEGEGEEEGEAQAASSAAAVMPPPS